MPREEIQRLLLKLPPSPTLSEILSEVGAKSTATLETFKELVQLAKSPVTEAEIAKCIFLVIKQKGDDELSSMSRLSLANNGSGSSVENNWNLEVFVKGIGEVSSHLNWNNVIRELDSPEFFLSDLAAYRILVTILIYPFSDLGKFPIKFFLTKWKNNVKAQISFLRFTLQTPDILNFSNYQLKKVISFEELTLSSGNSKSVINILYHQTWNCMELLDFLAGLVGTEYSDDSVYLLDLCSKQSPELLCLALANIKPLRHQALNDLLMNLTSGFIVGQQNSSVILSRLWHSNSNLVISCMVDLHRKDPTFLSRLLDVAQELKGLSVILDSKPYNFSIDMAALASRREHLNLEKWLQDKMKEMGNTFIRATLDFVSTKISYQLQRRDGVNSPPFIPLSQEVMNIFMESLNSSTSLMSPECLSTFHDIKNILERSGGPDSNVSPQDQMAAPVFPSDVQFPRDIEEEANSYFEKIYSKEISIKEMVDLLTRFKNSKLPREQDVFTCMIHNLFDEYRFFPNYPEKELSLTAVLFGSLIQYQLVAFVPLGIALRYVLDALRKPVGSKMFKFGLQAMLQFQSRLGEWPQYCTHLLQIPQLHQVFPDLVSYIRQIIVTPLANSNNSANNGNNNLGPSNNALSNSGNSTPPDFVDPSGAQISSIKSVVVQEKSELFHSIRVGRLASEVVNTEIVQPGEAIQDKILFIINNITEDNMESKLKELSEVLRDEFQPWFSQYLVVKRAAVEPNYHPIYISLLFGLDRPRVEKLVLLQTFINMKELIVSEKTLSSSSDRTLLKNLGTWLGGITIARNTPLLYKYICLRELLLEGYQNDRLIVVIPFVCKVLEQSNKSIAFKPFNPWLMRILKLLVELYHFAELKLNLKFEIEVLCKNIEVNMKNITPSDELKRIKVGGPSIAYSVNPAITTPLIQDYNTPVPNVSAASDVPISLMNLISFVSFNPQFDILPNGIIIKKVMLLGIDFAIREVAAPVVERAIAIACITTREIILKDFAIDGNDERMKNAALNMIQNVAGNLALATSKEPLRNTLLTNLRNFVQAAGLEAFVSEQVIQTVIEDNMDLCCAYVEKMAIEKSCMEITESLGNAFSLRKKHRERTNQPFIDPSFVNASRYFVYAPDALRPKPGGLSVHQLRIYEDFSRHTRMNSLASLQGTIPPLTNVDYERAGTFFKTLSTGSVTGGGVSAAPATTAAAAVVPGSEPNNGTFNYPPNFVDDVNRNVLSTQQCLERFLLIIAEVEKIVHQNPSANLSSFTANHELRNVLRQILVVVLHAYNRDEVALLFSQKVVQILYKTDSPLLREISVILLDKLCEISAKVAKEVTTWIIYSDDERKYNVPVTVALLLSGLLNVVEYDMQMAKVMETGKSTTIDFCVNLIRKCVLDEPAIASPYDFVYSIEALNRIAQRSKGPEALVQLLDDISMRIQNVQDDDPSNIRNRIAVVFNDWLRLFQYPNTDEKTLAPFVLQLQQQGILKDEEMTKMFFRVCTELSVEYYVKNRASPISVAYQGIDALSRLIVLLIKYTPSSDESLAGAGQINLLVQVLSVISVVLVQSMERKNFVVQRPFSKLFCSLLEEFNSLKEDFAPIQSEMLIQFSNLLYLIQPKTLPSYTFAWVEVVSNRYLLPNLLDLPEKKGWPHMQRLIVGLLKFLELFLRNLELKEPVRVLYRGTLRVLLVLLHDYPDFLAEYHVTFCDVIPSTCIQLRNLILSAFPANMKLPDPFTPDLKVDLLAESNMPPSLLTDFTATIKSACPGLVDLVEDFFKQAKINNSGNKKITLLHDIAKKLLSDSNSSSNNGSLLHAFTLYVGVRGIEQLRGTSSSTDNLEKSSSLELFKFLLNEFNGQDRYALLNCLTNQLRYPNSHTLFFSCLILLMFSQLKDEGKKEQITRVLLERLIVNRPHPWGLLITFIELIKNPLYSFWTYAFTRLSPDIERLFDSVAKSCTIVTGNGSMSANPVVGGLDNNNNVSSSSVVAVAAPSSN